MRAASRLAALLLLVACDGDDNAAGESTLGTAGQTAMTAGTPAASPGAAGSPGPAIATAGTGAAGSGGTPARGASGMGGSGDAGSTPAAGAGAAAPGAGGTDAGVTADGSMNDASQSAGDAQVSNPSGPIDYGARGPHEIVIEKNVGERFRNTNLTDDSARCASLVAGLGDDADSGDWALYPEDMDRQLYTLFRPAKLEEGVKYPVITWGNGTCSQPISFEQLLSHLASHGFIVVASNWRWVAGGVEMRRALDFVIAENERADSVLFGKIAVDRLGASGHSQGSTAAVTVGADDRIVTTVPIQGASAAGVRQLSGPTFLIAGERDMVVSASSIESAYRAASVPAAYGLSLGHDHVMPVTMPQPILKAVTGWFRIHLADDRAARELFFDGCTLCSDPTWRFMTKL